MFAWKPEDKKWLAARKREWAPIKKNLQFIDELNRQQIKALEEYFLTGKEPKKIYLGDTYFWMIYRLWFHADRSEENWQEILSQTSPDDFKESRGLFYLYARDVDRFVSDYGFMGGLEKRFVKLFFPSTDPLAKFEFNGVQFKIVTSPSWSFKIWQENMSYWLTYNATNPYCCLQYLTDLMWNCLPLVDPEKLKSFGNHPYPDLLCLFSQCAHYVEPRGLPGDNTPQRRFAEYMQEELNKRDLPPFIQQVWEEVQTSSGRNAVFIVDKWKYEHKRIKDDELEWNDRAYFTLILHGKEVHPDFFEIVHAIYVQLELTAAPFSEKEIETVNLGPRLTEQMFERLGYKSGADVPGYRFRIHTTKEYVDSESMRIDVDLIMPVLHPNMKPNEETPILFIVPRPAKAYATTIAYNHNIRFVRRHFKKRTGLDLVRYANIKGKVSLNDKMNPFYKTVDQPFNNDLRAFEDKPEYDFPKWQGTPLPALFS